VKNVSVCVNL